MKIKHRLKKVMGSSDILVIAFGAMIGWGWVVASGRWIQSAGTIGTIIGFIIGGWALLGLIFYIVCKKRYKEEFGTVHF